MRFLVTGNLHIKKTVQSFHEDNPDYFSIKVYKVRLSGNSIIYLHVVLFCIKSLYNSMNVSGFSCTQVTSISVISMVFSGYWCIPLLVHSRLILQLLSCSTEQFIYVLFYILRSSKCYNLRYIVLKPLAHAHIIFVS